MSSRRTSTQHIGQGIVDIVGLTKADTVDGLVQGVSLSVILNLLAGSLIGAWLRAGRATRLFLLTMAAGSVIGTLAGGQLLGLMPSAFLLPALACILLVSAVKVWQHA